jgi:hypothetical protein
MAFISQPSLDFNVREAVRATDPVTSLMAAEKIAPHVSTGRMLALKCHYEHPEGLDDFQLSELTGIKQTSVGKRRGELERMGYVEKGERRVGPSKLTNSIVYSYRITRAGISFYENREGK